MKPSKKQRLSGRAVNIDTSNPHARIAICLCLDTSASMLGHPIRELNSGMRLFYKALWQNSESRYAADIAVITFGCNGVQCVQNFAQLYEGISPPVLRADGMTPMGEAVNLALDLIEERRQNYRELDIRHYHSRLIIMADGKPNGSTKELKRAMSRSRDMVNKNILFVIPVGVGNDADFNVLSQFSTRVTPVKLSGLNFSSFFKWLSISVEQAAAQTPGYEDSLMIEKSEWIDGSWDDIFSAERN